MREVAAGLAIVILVAILTILYNFAMKPDTHCPRLTDASGHYDNKGCD